MLVIAGTVRAPPENLAELRPHMLVVLKASQAEDGCIVYSYAEDIEEPGLIRIFEAWRDGTALSAADALRDRQRSAPLTRLFPTCPPCCSCPAMASAPRSSPRFAAWRPS
jgi:quinol monooxygenase YgiN